MIPPKLPEDVLSLLYTLNQGGFEAYIVGGCVRDSILGYIPKDWDITTSAEPAQTKALFPHTFDTGIQHGTVTVVLNKVNYEITTYRVEGKYEDYRRPAGVSFTKSLQEDLLRRDFTMNAIAYHPKDGFRDYFNGKEDIAAMLIRGVGDPSARFREDALRMLRCVRFAAQLGFQVEAETYAALCANTALIQHISVERIRDEMEKLWLSAYTDKMPLLWESGLLAQIAPCLSQSLMARKDSLLPQVAQAPCHAHIRWSIILAEETDEDVHKFLRYLKFDNDSIKRIRLLVALIREDLPLTAYPLRMLGGKIGAEALSQALILQKILRPASPHGITAEVWESILTQKDCLSLKELTVDGKALLSLGIPKGKVLGDVLAFLLDAVHKEPKHNNAPFLLALAKEYQEKKGL